MLNFALFVGFVRRLLCSYAVGQFWQNSPAGQMFHINGFGQTKMKQSLGALLQPGQGRLSLLLLGVDSRQSHW